MAEITSTTGNWRVIEIGAFGSRTRTLGDYSGTIQDIALKLSGTASNLLFTPIDPVPVTADELTGMAVRVKVDGLQPDAVKALLDADIAAGNLDMSAEVVLADGAVQINVGLTEESAAQLQQRVTANIALSRLTQEQRDALMATHLLCPVGGA